MNLSDVVERRGKPGRGRPKVDRTDASPTGNYERTLPPSYKVELQRQELTIMETTNRVAALKLLLDSETAIVTLGTKADLRFYEGDTDDERRENMYADLRRAKKACADIREKLTLLTDTLLTEVR
jgi:hypothetical protein